eukprot:scaffold12965_cov241-Isochrysis_galbana.AAC.4
MAFIPTGPSGSRSASAASAARGAGWRRCMTRGVACVTSCLGGCESGCTSVPAPSRSRPKTTCSTWVRCCECGCRSPSACCGSRDSRLRAAMHARRVVSTPAAPSKAALDVSGCAAEDPSRSRPKMTSSTVARMCGSWGGRGRAAAPGAPSAPLAGSLMLTPTPADAQCSYPVAVWRRPVPPSPGSSISP